VKWTAVVAILPGPSHAGKRVDITFQPLVKELLTLYERGLEVSDLLFQSKYIMHVYLGTVSADTIARASLMMVGGVRHYLADQKTLWRGTNMVASGLSEEDSGRKEGEAMRFMGYKESMWQPFMLVGGGDCVLLDNEEDDVQGTCMVKADEERLWLSDKSQRWLGQEVSLGRVGAQQVGRHGVAPLSQLPYFDTVHGYETSVVHAAFYGVAKDFCELILGKVHGGSVHINKLSAADIKEISKRGEGIRSPPSLRRAYTDIVTNMGTRSSTTPSITQPANTCM